MKKTLLTIAIGLVIQQTIPPAGTQRKTAA